MFFLSSLVETPTGLMQQKLTIFCYVIRNNNWPHKCMFIEGQKESSQLTIQQVHLKEQCPWSFWLPEYSNNHPPTLIW